MRARAAPPVLLSLLMLGTLSMASRGWAAWPHDPNNGNVALCTAANDQYYQTIVSDGAGGAIVTWVDTRSGNWGIYAQRVNAAGVPQWTADGVALCTAANDQDSPTIVSDGAGGAIVTWFDLRSGSADIYAQRVNAAGVPQWMGDGVALCIAANDQRNPTIVTDGAGGAIVTWEDARSGTNWHIYAQRVERIGQLGNPEPVPRELALALTSSNPGRGGASLRYSLPQAGAVRLAIYDLAGREVRVLASGRLDAGDYSARWDGRNVTGQPVRGGMYLVRLEAEGQVPVLKLALLP